MGIAVGAGIGDPIDDLTHDHGAVTRLMQALHDVLGRLRRGEAPTADIANELADGAASLHDALLSHFAREEEVLFPFVTGELPNMAERAEALRIEHDTICAAASELLRAARLVSTAAGAFSCTVALSRFEQVHARHSEQEIAFLRDVGGALDAEARAKLSALLAST